MALPPRTPQVASGRRDRPLAAPTPRMRQSENFGTFRAFLPKAPNPWAARGLVAVVMAQCPPSTARAVFGASSSASFGCPSGRLFRSTPKQADFRLGGHGLVLIFLRP